MSIRTTGSITQASLTTLSSIHTRDIGGKRTFTHLLLYIYARLRLLPNALPSIRSHGRWYAVFFFRHWYHNGSSKDRHYLDRRRRSSSRSNTHGTRASKTRARGVRIGMRVVIACTYTDRLARRSSIREARALASYWRSCASWCSRCCCCPPRARDIVCTHARPSTTVRWAPRLWMLLRLSLSFSAQTRAHVCVEGGRRANSRSPSREIPTARRGPSSLFLAFSFRSSYSTFFLFLFFFGFDVVRVKFLSPFLRAPPRLYAFCALPSRWVAALGLILCSDLTRRSEMNF